MSNPQPNQEGIAIIGMAGRFPKAKTIDEFWQNLRQGVEAISFFADEELEAAGISFPKNNPNYVKARGLLEQADHFDAAFVIDVGKLIHSRTIEVLHSYYNPGRANLTIILMAKSDPRAVKIG